MHKLIKLFGLAIFYLLSPIAALACGSTGPPSTPEIDLPTITILGSGVTGIYALAKMYVNGRTKRSKN